MLQCFATKTPIIVLGRVRETLPSLRHNATNIFQREAADRNAEDRDGHIVRRE
jgi:hypothetical protein